jgi:glutamate-1-semialdehyde aminotransferase
MSDGFWAYRELDQRRRGLAHLIRKAQALEDGLEPAAQRFGTAILTVLATVMAAVYDARGAPPPVGTLRARHAPMLNALLAQCLQQVDAPHEKM